MLRLTDGWPRWVSSWDLAQIALQYNARISSLRRQGWLIQNRVTVVDGIRHGEFRLGTAPVPSNKELRRRREAADTATSPLTLFDLGDHRDDG